MYGGCLLCPLYLLLKRSYSTQLPKCFSPFLARKTLWVKLFSLNVCEAALQAALKGGNFGAKFTHLCGFWLDVSFFFFTCENHPSLLWLARTNLRAKIYDIAFWWVFLIMYIINSNMPKPWKWYHFRAEILRVVHCREYHSRLTRFTE